MTATAPVPASVQPPGDAPIWRNRAFMLLWIAQAIGSTAQNAIWYGILVLVQSRSHSSTQMSLAIMTLIVPSVLFGLIAGAYVDRWEKRMVLVGTCFLRAALTLGYIAFSEQLALVYVVNLLFATVGQFFLPAEAAMIPAIVPRARLMQANSLFHLTFTASQLVGIVMLGPLVVNLVGVHGLFAVVAGLIGLCGLLVWPLPAGMGERQASGDGKTIGGLLADIREVGRFVRGDVLVRLAVGHWTLGATLAMIVAMLAPGFAEAALGVRAEDSVFVLAPAGAGMVLSTMILSRYGQYWDKHRLIDWGLLIVAASLIVLGLARPLANLVAHPALGTFELPGGGANPLLVACVMVTTLVAGMAFVCVIVASQTIIQERVPVAARGRVFAVQLVLSNLVSIVPLVFLGGIADLIGVGQTLMLLGGLILLIALVTVRQHRGLATPRATG